VPEDRLEPHRENKESAEVTVRGRLVTGQRLTEARLFNWLGMRPQRQETVNVAYRKSRQGQELSNIVSATPETKKMRPSYDIRSIGAVRCRCNLVRLSRLQVFSVCTVSAIMEPGPRLFKRSNFSISRFTA
jgi:hypothetical protein